MSRGAWAKREQVRGDEERRWRRMSRTVRRMGPRAFTPQVVHQSSSLIPISAKFCFPFEISKVSLTNYV